MTEIENRSQEQVQALLLAITNFREGDLYKVYQETFEQLRDESRDLALEMVPDGMKEAVEILEHKGGYRAFKRAATFFEDLAAELNKHLIEDE